MPSFYPVVVVFFALWFAHCGDPALKASATDDVPPAAASSGEAPGITSVAFDPRKLSHSGNVWIQQALGEDVVLPLDLAGSADAISYFWEEASTGRRSGAELLPPNLTVSSPKDPGVYQLYLVGEYGQSALDDYRLIVLTPLQRNATGEIEGYRIGRYPQSGTPLPRGFVRVTKEIAQLQVSAHFSAAEFLTHGQKEKWPKYLILDPRLLDKLELVMMELNSVGVPAHHMVIMSGYRTPQYNARGLAAGRAKLSRHQWGDAADVWIDNDLDWYMDDLNGDGRRDVADAEVILMAVNNVERKYPDLVGGAGIYRSKGSRGPFIHIDSRGVRSRW